MGVKIFTDGSDDLDEAILNKMISGDGIKTQIEVNYAHIKYTGAAWNVDSTEDSCDIETGDLAWSTNKLTIAIAGYTNPPIVLAQRCTTPTTAFHVSAEATSNTNIDVLFWDVATGAQETVETTDCDFNILVIGV